MYLYEISQFLIFIRPTAKLKKLPYFFVKCPIAFFFQSFIMKYNDLSFCKKSQKLWMELVEFYFRSFEPYNIKH